VEGIPAISLAKGKTQLAVHVLAVVRVTVSGNKVKVKHIKPATELYFTHSDRRIATEECLSNWKLLYLYIPDFALRFMERDLSAYISMNLVLETINGVYRCKDCGHRILVL
jgi:hypothetical protein